MQLKSELLIGMHVFTFYIKSESLIGIHVSGEPGLVDKVLALHAGSRGFDSHRGTCPNNFSNPIDQDIRLQ